MSFLAPWALVVGVLAAVGAVLLHLVARQRPAAYVLPTTRFIPDRRTLVSRATTRPRDLALLALRVLLLLSAAAAFARPVLAPARGARGRIVLLDRSSAVADRARAVADARAQLGDDARGRLILFDRSATLATDARAALDSLARDSSPGRGTGSVSAALAAARRAAPLLAAESDSVELVLVSPVTASELDAATDTLRARWPAGIRIVRLAARADSATPWSLERVPDTDDPLAPALARASVRATPAAVRLRHSSPDAADSAHARGGGTVVEWESLGRGVPRADAIVMGDDVVVATVGRGVLPAGGRPIARWGDGEPAASEYPLGAGCIRRVAVGLQLAGDLPLRSAFQRIVRGLVAPCGGVSVDVPADAAAMQRLAGSGGAASARALSGDAQQPSPWVPWLLALALLCALAELGVRARTAPERA